MASLDTLLDNFEISPSSDSEEGDDLNTALPELRNNRYRLSQLPAPPPPLSDDEIEQFEMKHRATIERSQSGSFKKFNLAPNSKINENQRLMVLQEMITSEQDYVKDVAYIVQVKFIIKEKK